MVRRDPARRDPARQLVLRLRVEGRRLGLQAFLRPWTNLFAPGSSRHAQHPIAKKRAQMRAALPRRPSREQTAFLCEALHRLVHLRPAVAGYDFDHRSLAPPDGTAELLPAYGHPTLLAGIIPPVSPPLTVCSDAFHLVYWWGGRPTRPLPVVCARGSSWLGLPDPVTLLTVDCLPPGATPSGFVRPIDAPPNIGVLADADDQRRVILPTGEPATALRTLRLTLTAARGLRLVLCQTKDDELTLQRPLALISL